MTYVKPHTLEDEIEWAEWIKELPEIVQVVAEKIKPWCLYRLKPTGQRVTFYSFGESEDGKVTLTVNVTGEFNLVDFDTQVFGIEVDDLEPCDLPSPDEPIGTLLTDEAEIRAHIEKITPGILAIRALREKRKKGMH